MTKAERVIDICRIHENGNMSKMAQKTGVTPAYISKLKNKPDSEPSELFLKTICRLYGVREEWMFYGSGEPYIQKTDEELIAQFFGEVESLDADSFTKRFIKMLASLNAEQRKVFEEMGQMLLDQEKKDE